MERVVLFTAGACAGACGLLLAAPHLDWWLGERARKRRRAARAGGVRVYGATRSTKP